MCRSQLAPDKDGSKTKLLARTLQILAEAKSGAGHRGEARHHLSVARNTVRRQRLAILSDRPPAAHHSFG